MPENDDPQLDRELLESSPIKDADLVMERLRGWPLAPPSHRRVGWQMKPVEIELLKGALVYRFTKAQVESMDRLTAALDRASRSGAQRSNSGCLRSGLRPSLWLSSPTSDKMPIAPVARLPLPPSSEGTRGCPCRGRPACLPVLGDPRVHAVQELASVAHRPYLLWSSCDPNHTTQGNVRATHPHID